LGKLNSNKNSGNIWEILMILLPLFLSSHKKQILTEMRVSIVENEKGKHDHDVNKK
jgi:hypothetical protein